MKNKILQITTFLLLLAFTNSCCKEDEPCVEKIKSDCGCYQIYEPVCGCNGKTYGNDCEAECAGITDYTEGACE